jgi:hypothetical protein
MFTLPVPALHHRLTYAASLRPAVKPDRPMLHVAGTQDGTTLSHAVGLLPESAFDSALRLRRFDFNGSTSTVRLQPFGFNG